MRVGQIVSYVSQDGAFGGPVAVAIAQSTELCRLGHDVELIAGWDGSYAFGQKNFRTRLYKVQNFGTKLTSLYSLPLLKQVWNSKKNYDILHIHLGRDLITMVAAAIAKFRGIPLVVQTHGMIMPDKRLVSRIFDAVLTRRVMASSHVVLTLSHTETAGVCQVSRGRAQAELLTNGVRSDIALTDRADGPPRVVFLARLHSRKRVMAFAQAASSLLREGREAVFLVYGPDEGDLPELLAYLEAEGLAGIRYEGAIKPGSAPSVLRGAAAYVLPSFGEVVPMTILESMAVGTPVVLTTDCAMADSLSAANAAMVTDGTAAAIASSIAALLDDPEMASMMAGRATRLLNESYSVEAVAQRLENVYSAANSS